MNSVAAPLPSPPPIVLRSPEPLLPAFDNAKALIEDTKLPLPPEIVQGFLHKGTKGIIASTSKAGKTWLLLDLALSVASGTNFLRWATNPGRVLFVNFEIQRTFIRERVQTLVAKKGGADPGLLDIWTLRGQPHDFDEVLDELIRRINGQDHQLIILDPIYKAMVGRSENAASGVGVLCHNLDRVIAQTGASVVFAHHFTKGKQAAKSPMDRLSGSGVFARDADTIMTLTEHEREGCYVVELTLRNLPQQPAFVVEWQYPLMVLRPELSPEDFKNSKNEDEN